MPTAVTTFLVAKKYTMLLLAWFVTMLFLSAFSSLGTITLGLWLLL